MNRTDYRAAGVDIDAGNEAVKRIKPHLQRTFTSAVLSRVGSFGSFFDLKVALTDFTEPVLVQSMDGVGTKAMVARLVGRFNSIGVDLVSACCNDIIVHGARPFTFLDYIASERLEPAAIEAMVAGMAQACRENGIALVGGETAEMPGTYQSGEHDLVGVVTGIVEKSRIIDGSRIIPGDAVLAFPSCGLHTNGYSLARKLFFETAGYSVEDRPAVLEKSVGDTLIEPHLNYNHWIIALLDSEVTIKGMAHITGGGILENVPRILPQNCSVQIRRNTWPIPSVFSLMQEIGNLPDEEMYRTFNMGVGLILVVPPKAIPTIHETLQPLSTIYEIGKVVLGKREVHIL